jgi:hypothetical protein
MLIRHLEYLTALARERRFARAVAMCNVTRSTLSAGIKQPVMADYEALHRTCIRLENALAGPGGVAERPIHLYNCYAPFRIMKPS